MRGGKGTGREESLMDVVSAVETANSLGEVFSPCSVLLEVSKNNFRHRPTSSPPRAFPNAQSPQSIKLLQT